MFIIFGSPRSGTTLLADALDLHSEIIVPDETDFIVPALLLLDRIKESNLGKELITKLIPNTERFPASIGKYLNKNEVKKIIRKSEYDAVNILKSIYQRVAEKEGKKIAGDKSPNDLKYIRLIQRMGVLESDIKIIHIVRDVRGVINSLIKLKWVEGIELFYPRMWCDNNLHLHNYLKNKPERYHFLKYEDMVARPKEVFRSITDFLGVDFQDAILDNNQRGKRHLHMQHHQNLDQPFLVDKATAWKDELPPDALEQCMRQAGEAMKIFGYQ